MREVAEFGAKKQFNNSAVWVGVGDRMAGVAAACVAGVEAAFCEAMYVYVWIDCFIMLNEREVKGKVLLILLIGGPEAVFDAWMRTGQWDKVRSHRKVGRRNEKVGFPFPQGVRQKQTELFLRLGPSRRLVCFMK